MEMKKLLSFFDELPCSNMVWKILTRKDIFAWWLPSTTQNFWLRVEWNKCIEGIILSNKYLEIILEKSLNNIWW